MVEWKKLDTCLDFEQPTAYLVKSTEYDNSYDTPVLTAGQSLLLGYTNEKNGIYEASKVNPCIIFDDFTTSFHWIDYSFKVKSSAMKMLRPKAGVNFRFVYYSMKCIDFIPGGHQRHWISKYSQFLIPIPSLSEQERIVGILDTFTAAIDNLKEQIAQRRKQYEYYRDQLLDLEGKPGVEMKTLPEISDNRDRVRKPITSSKRKAGNYPYYGASGIVDYVDGYIFDGDYLLISEDGANLVARSTPIAFSITGKNWVNNHAHVLQFKDKATQKYVEIYLNMIDLEPWINGAAQPKLNQDNLNKISIPLPPLSEQQRIVSILDTFEASIANLEAQLAQREKQYEYYRNKLLTFE